MQINVSEPATLVCLITGFPLPTITWQKNNEDFTADSVGVNIFEFEVASSDSASASAIVDLLRFESPPHVYMYIILVYYIVYKM